MDAFQQFSTLQIVYCYAVRLYNVAECYDEVASD